MIISVTGYKGGSGKTTTAIHLAGVLATKNKTLLVDGDLNQSSLEWSGRGFFNFDVISKAKLKTEIENYTHVVIDTEARPSEGDLDTLVNVSDMMILPATPDALSIMATQKTLLAIDTDKVDVRILITQVPPPPSHDGADVGKFLKKEGLKVFKTQVKRFQAYKKASLAGCLVSQIKNNAYSGIAWDDYKKVVKEILK